MRWGCFIYYLTQCCVVISLKVNNAGVAIYKPTVDFTAEEYSFLMATNFDSAFHLCQLAHPLLKASGDGSIINISSICGAVSVDDLSIYGATKGIRLREFRFHEICVFKLPDFMLYSPLGAMNQLTKNLACEWAKDNIRTNCVAPGYIRTPLAQPVSHFHSK